VTAEQHIKTPQSIQPKALRVLAEIISYVFHPVFIPVFMALVVYQLQPASFMGVASKDVGMWFIRIISIAVFYPLFSIFLMKSLGLIKDYKMETAKERTIPLLATMIFYFWASRVFNNVQENIPLSYKIFLLGNFWGIIVVFIINIFTKISMHTTAAGGLLGLVIVLMTMSPVNMTIPLFIAIGLAGLIGTARMIVGAHQRGDVWLGYIIGILVQLGAYWYMK
jgi:hypothetical protein